MRLFWRKPKEQRAAPVEISRCATAIVQSLKERPEAWYATDCVLYTGSKQRFDAPITIWIGNGESGVRPDATGLVAFTDADKAALWQAFKDWQTHSINEDRYIETLKQAERWIDSENEAA